MLEPVFVAHRGYAAAFPENTLIALDAALNAGAKYVEVDIQLSADKVPVLFHDRDLQRLCEKPKAIHDYNYSELITFNLAYREKFSENYAENKITSLQDFIDYLKAHPQLNAFIELKRSMIETFGTEIVLNVILPMFKDMQNQISFISYHQDILREIDLNTDFSTGIVVDEWDEYTAASCWTPEWLFCSAEGLPADDNDLKQDSKIVVFEVGETRLAKTLLKRGIKYLETFKIKEMLAAFSSGK